MGMMGAPLETVVREYLCKWRPATKEGAMGQR